MVEGREGNGGQAWWLACPFGHVAGGSDVGFMSIVRVRDNWKKPCKCWLTGWYRGREGNGGQAWWLACPFGHVAGASDIGFVLIVRARDNWKKLVNVGLQGGRGGMRVIRGGRSGWCVRLDASRVC